MNLSEALETSRYLAERFSPASPPRLLRTVPFSAGTFAFNTLGLLKMLSIEEHESKVGMGVSPGTRRDDWRIAVRAWSEQDLKQPEMERELRRFKDAVEVRVTGPILATPPPLPLPDTRRQRPLVPGSSIAHYQVTAGTLGAFVRGAKGAVQVLSNNHVLANVNSASPGDAILQPAVRDGGVLDSDKVGQLSAFHQLQPMGNVVDAAVADIDPMYLPQDFSLPGIGQLQGIIPGVPAGVGPVQKVGRSTGHTHGRITALGLRNLPVKFGERTLRFDNVVEVEGTTAQPFSAPGDSGSLIVNADRYAVGLLFGGSSQSTYINPIDKVLELLAVELL